jgi:hypothetical protein
MFFQGQRKLGAFGFLDRNEVLDAQRVQHLAAEALGGDAGADALARGVHGRRCAGRAAADDQHVKRLLGAEIFLASRSRAPVSTLARISSRLMRPLPNMVPFRKPWARP